MTVALTAAGFGALHAVSGPDHLLSVAPLSVGRRRQAWRIGLVWGLGHAAGTAVAAAVLLALLSGAGLHVVDAWAERAAGLALVAMGAANLLALRRRRGMAAAGARDVRPAVFSVGLVHGVTGAAALLLVVPAVNAGASVKVLAILGFVAGSTAAMAALTAAIAALSAAAAPRLALATWRLPALASVVSVAVGIGWAIAA
ncbi:hypothetical protein [Anaeromyxobacter dehalogenans]|uniref:High-affinity nickel-transporter n=1 Tax=Anaeromyxobacter dehalogenans (strain 2CP-C) TaxID=290397 RepID=Q2IN56_ANADE|nr:hypothetical protein [Anaeromyxobacter dehalogenans]ABC80238.1 hypothetical protein Adeh_0462 [Anaeromyxobacter dehalogenans 2CP-C]